ncbi:hypothetical protein LBMAG52_05180 [Planctomycetia bacterium]|nr:hypothetical protein LBMAG52_05180 [Planctomycetia bacterium]
MNLTSTVPSVSIQSPAPPLPPQTIINNKGIVALVDFEAEVADEFEMEGRVDIRWGITSSDQLFPNNGRVLTHEALDFSELSFSEASPMRMVTRRIRRREELQFQWMVLSRTDDDASLPDRGIESRMWLSSSVRLLALNNHVKRLESSDFVARLTDSEQRAKLKEQLDRSGELIARIESGEQLPTEELVPLKQLGKVLGWFEASPADSPAIKIGRTNEIAAGNGAAINFVNRQPLKLGPRPVPVSEGQLTRTVLATERQLLDLYAEGMTPTQYIGEVTALRNRSQEQLAESFAVACHKEAEIARPYRDMDELFEQSAAGNTPPQPLLVINTSLSRLSKNKDLLQQIHNQLPSGNAFDLKDCVAFIVTTENLKSPVEAEILGRLSRRSRAIGVATICGGMTREEVKQAFEPGGVWHGLAGIKSHGEEWKGNVYLVTNDPTGVYGEFAGVMPLNGAMMTTGKIIAMDDQRCMPPAGQHAAYIPQTMPKKPTLERTYSDPESLELISSTANVFVRCTTADTVLWGVRLLSQEQVNVKRCIHVFERKLSETAQRNQFQPNTPAGQLAFRRDIDRWLQQNSGMSNDRMYLGGKVESITLGTDPVTGQLAPNRVHVIVKLGMKYVVEYTTVVLRDATLEYFLDQNSQGGWDVSDAKEG